MPPSSARAANKTMRRADSSAPMPRAPRTCMCTIHDRVAKVHAVAEDGLVINVAAVRCVSFGGVVPVQFHPLVAFGELELVDGHVALEDQRNALSEQGRHGTQRSVSGKRPRMGVYRTRRSGAAGGACAPPSSRPPAPGGHIAKFARAGVDGDGLCRRRGQRSVWTRCL